MKNGENKNKPERYTFHKSERLRHRTLVNSLFATGKSFYEWPLRLVWRVYSEEELVSMFKFGVPDQLAPLQLMITIPKKNRRLAVDRVLMRRRIREQYRLQRRNLRHFIEAETECRTVSVGIVYLAKKNADSEEISAKINLLLGRLHDELLKANLSTENSSIQ